MGLVGWLWGSRVQGSRPERGVAAVRGGSVLVVVRRVLVRQHVLCRLGAKLEVPLRVEVVVVVVGAVVRVRALVVVRC